MLAIGDFAVLRLGGKAAQTIVQTQCFGPDACVLTALWDFTEEARALAAQGGGELTLTLDPIPPTTFAGLTLAQYAFLLAANYPWRHTSFANSLTLTFEEACPQELKVTVVPESVLPMIPGSLPTTGTVKALVKSCPAESGSPPASVEVTFEVRPPAPDTAEAGGHAHDGARPKGSLRRDGQPATSCLATLDAEGMGSCTVTYHSSEVSGVESIVATALGFPAATATIRVEVPELVELAADPARYVLVGTPDNHALTNDPCRPVAPISRHFQNHSGLPELNAAVVAIAEKMLQETGILLRVNDMSLPQGGLFDIRNDWQTPHDTHRVGRHVDLGFSGVQSGVCSPYNRSRLEEAIRDVTKRRPRIEGNHFHTGM